MCLVKIYNQGFFISSILIKFYLILRNYFTIVRYKPRNSAQQSVVLTITLNICYTSCPIKNFKVNSEKTIMCHFPQKQHTFFQKKQIRLIVSLLPPESTVVWFQIFSYSFVTDLVQFT